MKRRLAYMVLFALAGGYGYIGYPTSLVMAGILLSYAAMVWAIFVLIGVIR